MADEKKYIVGRLYNLGNDYPGDVSFPVRTCGKHGFHQYARLETSSAERKQQVALYFHRKSGQISQNLVVSSQTNTLLHMFRLNPHTKKLLAHIHLAVLTKSATLNMKA